MIDALLQAIQAVATIVVLSIHLTLWTAFMLWGGTVLLVLAVVRWWRRGRPGA